MKLVSEIATRLKAEGYSFQSVRDAPWIPAIEVRFGFRFPALYRLLVTSFVFPEFDVGGLTFYANQNDGAYDDIGVAPFADQYLWPWLISNGFVQFGRPDTGSYDPVCFDMNSNPDNPHVVWFDHEDILQARSGVRFKKYADSLHNVFGETTKL